MGEKKDMLGKPDPYVVLTFGEHVEKSKIVKGDLNPEWNLEKVFDVSEKSSKEIVLKVYDKDTLTKDDFMGQTSVSISEIPNLKVGCWVPLQGCKSGEVLLSGELISSNSSNTTVQQDTTPADKYPQIIFILHSAQKLANKDTLGKSDPYALITLGSQVSKTETIKNDLNPTWQHQAIFQVDEKSPPNIHIALYDDDYGKDESLGHTSVSVDAIKKMGRISSQPKKLNDRTVGNIIYSAKYLDSKQSEDEIDNKPEKDAKPNVQSIIQSKTEVEKIKIPDSNKDSIDTTEKSVAPGALKPEKMDQSQKLTPAEELTGEQKVKLLVLQARSLCSPHIRRTRRKIQNRQREFES